MSFVELARGAGSLKSVEGKDRFAYSVIGVEFYNHPQGSDLSPINYSGIRLVMPESDDSYTWGLGGPMRIVQAWRGMKILEEIGLVEPFTLANCYHIVERKHPASRIDPRIIVGLANTFGKLALRDLQHEVDYYPWIKDGETERAVTTYLGLGKVSKLRRHTMRQGPPVEVLEHMINLLGANLSTIQVGELSEEINGGFIQQTPQIAKLQEDYQVWLSTKSPHKDVI